MNLSNASSSGFLQEVWPPTMAPYFVAATRQHNRIHHHVVLTAHTWPIELYKFPDRFGFYAVDDVVACSRYMMAIDQDLNARLYTFGQMDPLRFDRVTYNTRELFFQGIEVAGLIAGDNSAECNQLQ